MAFHALTAIVFLSLVYVAILSRFVSSGPKMASLSQRSTTSMVVLHGVLLIGFPIINAVIFRFETMEIILAAVLFWLTAITFLIILLRLPSLHFALALSAIIAEAAIVFVELSSLSILNNILLIVAVGGSLIFIIQSNVVPVRLILSIMVALMVFDIAFVWIVPAIPSIVSAIQPFTLSIILRIQGLVLGAGDLVVLAAAFLILARKRSILYQFIIAVVLSLTIEIIALIDLLNLRGDAFPVLVVLVPLFFIIYTIQQKQRKKTV